MARFEQLSTDETEALPADYIHGRACRELTLFLETMTNREDAVSLCSAVEVLGGVSVHL